MDGSFFCLIEFAIEVLDIFVSFLDSLIVFFNFRFFLWFFLVVSVSVELAFHPYVSCFM